MILVPLAGFIPGSTPVPTGTSKLSELFAGILWLVAVSGIAAICFGGYRIIRIKTQHGKIRSIKWIGGGMVALLFSSALIIITL
ncbi:hypothetical protein ACWCQZ_50420 [Streptomyces sp. NPDC002285]